MRNRKYYIALDDFERRVVVNCKATITFLA